MTDYRWLKPSEVVVGDVIYVSRPVYSNRTLDYAGEVLCIEKLPAAEALWRITFRETNFGPIEERVYTAQSKVGVRE